MTGDNALSLSRGIVLVWGPDQEFVKPRYVFGDNDPATLPWHSRQGQCRPCATRDQTSRIFDGLAVHLERLCPATMPGHSRRVNVARMGQEVQLKVVFQSYFLTYQIPITFNTGAEEQVRFLGFITPSSTSSKHLLVALK